MSIQDKTQEVEHVGSSSGPAEAPRRPEGWEESDDEVWSMHQRPSGHVPVTPALSTTCSALSLSRSLKHLPMTS